ncbi:GNAT family N-acetyltransferase [Arthrobacter sp. ISL-30]|uniref:GNAT family N-acetyltransferase n=1 Tax=Arthrobacter sp. ISL-30 TaxID=2819109 RepID=UPI0027DFDADC|nr:GNAT family N-acetyltransferase [Arthrobacter sp. ISL-30]
MPRIRRLVPQDWALLRDVRLEMIADTPMAYIESLASARRQTETQWQARAGTMSGPDSITLVADDGTEGSRFCGLMRVVLRHPHAPGTPLQAVLSSVYVAPERRGLGLADNLIDAAKEAAVELGAEVLELGVHEENDRAKRFYQRHGFSLNGASRSYPQHKSKRELLMECKLPEAPKESR